MELWHRLWNSNDWEIWECVPCHLIFLVLGTRSTNQGILVEKASLFHGELFLIILYKYEVEFSSRDRLRLVFLWRELVFLQLHCIFLQGRNCIDENNEDWCHVQFLNLVLLYKSLSFLGLGHPRSLRALLYHFLFLFSLLIHMHLLFLFLSISAFSINDFLS